MIAWPRTVCIPYFACCGKEYKGEASHSLKVGTVEILKSCIWDNEIRNGWSCMEGKG